MAERTLLAAVALAAAVVVPDPSPSIPPANEPANCERTVPETAPTAHTSAVEAFALIEGWLDGADGSVTGLCLLVADTPDLQSRGLMGVEAPEQLGGADGMVFVWDDPVSLQFYMWQTPMPLTIGFFDADGSWLAGADMEPCLDDTAAACERYRSPEPYATALEVPQEALPGALGPGAVLHLAGAATTETTSDGDGDAL